MNDLSRLPALPPTAAPAQLVIAVNLVIEENSMLVLFVLELPAAATQPRRKARRARKARAATPALAFAC